MSDISEGIRDLVKKGGDVVGLDTPQCILWKSDHDSCKGCECELGCGKVVRVMLLMMTPMVYKPNGFEDFQKMEARMHELTDLTLKAKTAQELHELPEI